MCSDEQSNSKRLASFLIQIPYFERAVVAARDYLGPTHKLANKYFVCVAG
jgi:hypothetical protein